MTAAGADGIGCAELNEMGPPTGHTQFKCQSERFFAVREMGIAKIMTRIYFTQILDFFFFKTTWAEQQNQSH